MDTEPGPSRGLRPVKQEVGLDSGFDLLNMLATVATQELKIHTVEDENEDTGSDTITNGDMNESDEEDFDKFGYVKAEEEDIKPSTRSLQPKKLAEMDLVDLEQIKAMSGNTLVRIFAETDFDELKKMYSYACLLLPVDCKEKFQSFGNESKAKKEIRQHLEKHVDELLEAGATGFTAEPIIARKKRLLGLTTARPLIKKRGIVRIKVEPDVSSGPSIGIEKENSNNCPLKRRKDDPGFKPLLSEISNEQDLKRPRVKKEFTATKQDISQDFYEPTYEEFDQAPLFEGYQLLRRLEAANTTVKQEEVATELKHSKSCSGQVVMAARSAIDEDHCYAAKPGQIKPEYVDYDSDSQHEGIEQKNQDDIAYGAYDHQMRDGNQYMLVDQKQDYQYSYSCADDGTPTVEVGDYQTEVGQPQFYGQEITYMQTPTFVPSTQPENHPMEHEPNQVQVEMESNLVGQPMDTNNEKPKVVRKAKDSDGARVKNKKTLAAVSREDKLKALNAMDQLRARGATTEDLKCRLCTPPRPFTAYSTLLTHYKSHAGLRPFECTICQAAFTRQHSLNYHLMTHANQTRFTCPHCSRKFRHPTHFKEHVKKHGEVVQFSCPDCPASYTVQNQYRRHLKVRHCKTIDILGNVVEITPEKSKSKVIQKKQDDQKINSKRKNRRKTKIASKPDDQLVQVSRNEEYNLMRMAKINSISQNKVNHMRNVPGHLTADYHYGDTTSNDEEVEEYSQVNRNSKTAIVNSNEQPVMVSQSSGVVSLVQPGTVPSGSGERPIFIQPGTNGMQHGTIIGSQTHMIQPSTTIICGNTGRIIAPATGLMGSQQHLLQPGTLLSGNSLRLLQPGAVIPGTGNQTGFAFLPAASKQSNQVNYINNNKKDENSPVVFVVPNETSQGIGTVGRSADNTRRPLMVTSQQSNQKILEQSRNVAINKHDSPSNAKQNDHQVLLGQYNKQKVLLVPKKLEEVSSTKMSFLQPVEKINRLSDEPFWKVPQVNTNQSIPGGSYNIPISTLDSAKFIIASEPEKTPSTIPYVSGSLESQTSIVTTVHSKPRVVSTLDKDTFSATTGTKEVFPSISSTKGSFSPISLAKEGYPIVSAPKESYPIISTTKESSSTVSTPKENYPTKSTSRESYPTISKAKESFSTLSVAKETFPSSSVSRESFPTMSATLLGHKVIKIMHGEEKVEQETSRLEHYLKYGTVYGYPETPQSPVKTKTNTEVSFTTVQRPKMSEATQESPTKSNILEQALQHVFPSSQLDNMNEMMSDGSENSDENIRTSDYSSQDFSFYEESEKMMQMRKNAEGTPKAQVNVYNPKKSPLENRNKILCDILGIGAEYVPSQ